MKNLQLHTEWTIRDITNGFQYDENEGKGTYGMGGRLIIQPPYQRNYVYGNNGKDVELIQSVVKGFPIGVMYFLENTDEAGNKIYEILDGQQRITSLGRYVKESWSFPVEINGTPQFYHGLDKDLQKKILDTPLLIYTGEVEPSEIKEWFKNINLQGVALTSQELRNAAYYGPFVSAAKEIFSNKAYAPVNIWKTYISTSKEEEKIERQGMLETALKWISKAQKISIDEYMSKHRNDNNANELKNYFDTVIDWVTNTFECTKKSIVQSVDWNALYLQYHNNPYNIDELNRKINKYLADPDVLKKSNVFEYVLGGEKDEKILNIREFDDTVRVTKYYKQTEEAKKLGISNCPECAGENGENAAKIWEIEEMDADHIIPWSKGGKTIEDNCQMLCRHHNRSKGNN